MKSIEFCYWLQGLFELNTPIEINANQTALIRKHLKMVFVHEKQTSQHFDFCKGLNGYLNYSDVQAIDSQVTERLKIKLSGLFVHVNPPEPLTFPKVYSPNPGIALSPLNKSELILC